MLANDMNGSVDILLNIAMHLHLEVLVQRSAHSVGLD